MKVRKTNPEYYVVMDGKSGKAYVEHQDNGILIEEVDDMAAAQAIAVLANTGHLFRSDDGTLCLSSYSDPSSVTTMEEFMEDSDYENNDDGPTDQDDVEIDSDEYGPLESTGDTNV